MTQLTGLWIPLEYLRNPRLSRNELVIISYVKYRLQENVFTGNHTEISQALQLKKPRVSESISALFLKGFLDKTEDQKHYIISERYLTIEDEKVTESVTITETVKVTESVTKSYGNRNKKVTETVTLSYIEKDIKKENNNNSASDDEISIIDSKKEESFKEKKQRISKLQEVTFLESELADFSVFEEFLKSNHPDLDTNYYYHKISTWLDKETGLPPKRKVWKSTVKIFLENDYKRMELVTNTKNKPHGKSNGSPRQTNLFAEKAVELDNLIDQYFAN